MLVVLVVLYVVVAVLVLMVTVSVPTAVTVPVCGLTPANGPTALPGPRPANPPGPPTARATRATRPPGPARKPALPSSKLGDHGAGCRRRREVHRVADLDATECAGANLVDRDVALGVDAVGRGGGAGLDGHRIGATAVTVPVSRFARVVANGPGLTPGAGDAGAGADGLGVGLVAADGAQRARQNATGDGAARNQHDGAGDRASRSACVRRAVRMTARRAAGFQVTSQWAPWAVWRGATARREGCRFTKHRRGNLGNT